MNAPCTHIGKWQPGGMSGMITPEGQASIYVSVVCGECGAVWLRGPQLDEGDIRMAQLKSGQAPVLPFKGRG